MAGCARLVAGGELSGFDAAEIVEGGGCVVGPAVVEGQRGWTVSKENVVADAGDVVQEGVEECRCFIGPSAILDDLFCAVADCGSHWVQQVL